MNNIEEILKNAKRYLVLKNEMIQHKPHHYDGLPYGRFDLLEPSESNDLDSLIDNFGFKTKNFYTQTQYDKIVNDE